MKDIVLAGIQGSGKGTQCDLLLKKMRDKINYFEAGGILRALQSKPNAIWSYVNDIVNSWALLPDQFMVKVFDLFLFCLQKDQSILVDWFPRQLGQMHPFLEVMKNNNRDLMVIVLDIPKEESIKRLTSRRMCKSCWAIANTHIHDCEICPSCGNTTMYQREDDKDISSIETRLDLFEKETKPVIDYLQKEGLVKVINGMQTPENVFKDILDIIGW